MNSKEKILVVSLFVLVGFGVGYAIINSLFLRPAADARESIEKSQQAIDGYDRQINSRVVLDKKLKDFLAKTPTGRFEVDPADAQRLSGMRLRELALAAGLDNDTLSLRAISGRSSSGKGDFFQIGWTVDARGELKSVVDYIYMVRQLNYIQRIDNLKMVCDLTTLEMTVSFNYYTIALKATTKEQKKQAAKPLDIEKLPKPVEADLASATRKGYDAIVTRDLFRPYIKRTPPPEPPKPKPEPKPDPRPVEPPKRPSTDRYFRVIGLPNFSADPAAASILICDTRSDAVKEYSVGETLAEGEIVMVDYRAMPSHADSELICYSRIIVRREDGYYAIDLGELLAAAHKLEGDQLPPELRSDDQSDPADTAEPSDEYEAAPADDAGSGDEDDPFTAPGFGNDPPLERPEVEDPAALGIPGELGRGGCSCYVGVA